MTEIQLPGPLSLQCNHCNLNASGAVVFAEYFSPQANLCQACGKPFDLLRMLADSFSSSIWPNDAIYYIGGKRKVFNVQLIPGQVLTLPFEEHGVPLGAMILDVNYTPQGGNLFPTEIHGNQMNPSRYLRNVAILYPAELRVRTGETPPQTTPVAVMVTWVDPSTGDEAFMSLFDAFYYYHVHDYQRMVIPAHVAVEIALFRYLHQSLARAVPDAKAARFLRDAATYSHQLNILLPYATALLGTFPLPDTIRGQLNRLNKLRNGIAHTGRLEGGLDRPGSAELLSAAFLAYVYLSGPAGRAAEGIDEHNKSLEPTP